MLHKLPKLIAFLFLLCLHFSGVAQVTQLSNNTSLKSGLVVNGKALLLSVNDSLWITNALTGGTKKLTSAVSVIDTVPATVYNNKLFFAGRTSTAGVELWASDGTTAGTLLIKDIRAGSANSIPDNFFVFNNKLYFTANDGSHGRELWVTNGTAAGTLLVKDIYAGTTSGLATTVQFIANNGVLYFTAKDATNGNELWKTNGTASGTALVKNITSGSASTDFTQFINLGTSVLFGIKVLVNGFDPQFQLWKTTGTSTGTTLLKNFGTFSGFFPPSFFAFKGKVYFIGTSYTTTGSELWVTNGTGSGTTLVKDIYPGTNNSTPFLFNAVIIGSKFFFTATDSRGAELWGSDGTSAGTTIVKDIYSGSAGSNPIVLKNYSAKSGHPDTSLYNGKIFFIANNGTKGEELWITNGTATGTIMVKDIWVGKKSGIPDSAFSYFYTTAGLYFSANDSLKGIEPWVSNGTATGTKLVADINAGKKNAFPTFLYIYNSQLLFNATNGDNTAGKTDLYKVNTTVTPLSEMVLAKVISVEEIPSDLRVWPNPAHDQLNLSVAGQQTNYKVLRILDNSGKVVLQQNFDNTRIVKPVNITILPIGVYYLQLISDKQSKTMPFVKE